MQLYAQERVPAAAPGATAACRGGVKDLVIAELYSVHFRSDYSLIVGVVSNTQRTMLCTPQRLQSNPTSTSGRQLPPPVHHMSLRRVSYQQLHPIATTSATPRAARRRSTIMAAAAGGPKAPGRPGKTPDDIIYDEAYHRGEVRNGLEECSPPPPSLPHRTRPHATPQACAKSFKT